MSQDNSKRRTALADIEAALKTVGIFREISGTVKSWEEAQVFPSVYFTGGDGDREPKDIQYAHYSSIADFIVIVYVHATETKDVRVTTGGLGALLERVVELTINAIDDYNQEENVGFLAHGYRAYVSRIETDGGAIRMLGADIAAATLIVRASLPPSDRT
jgi:hypothetical protein